MEEDKHRGTFFDLHWLFGFVLISLTTDIKNVDIQASAIHPNFYLQITERNEHLAVC